MKVQDLMDDNVIALDAMPEDLRNPTPKMPDIKVSESGIVKLLKNLKPKRQQVQTGSSLSFCKDKEKSLPQS